MAAWLPILLAFVGGSLGWMVPRWRRERRSLFDETPAGMTREQYRSRRAQRARQRRYALVLLGAVFGAGMGYLTLLIRS